MSASHRQRVLSAVIASCRVHGRAVTSQEVAAVLEAGDCVPHLDAVLGSLVRTKHVDAARARPWAREQRNVYRVAGSAYAVEPSAVPPSRAEQVFHVIDALWRDATRGGAPITSREIRARLRAETPHDPICLAPTLLPTVLNDLRRPGRHGAPMIRSVRVAGIRAQAWIPADAPVPRVNRSAVLATATDRVAMALEAALERSRTALVSALEVRTAWAERFPHLPAEEVPRLLWDASRPVSAGSRGRVARREPAVVRVGEVGGLALYTTPALLAGSPGSVGAARTEFGWRRWLEGWTARGLDEEVEWLRTHSSDWPLYPARLGLALHQRARFDAISRRLEGRTSTLMAECPFRSAALVHLRESQWLMEAGTHRPIPAAWRRQVGWLSVEAAEAWAIRTFNLGEDPPCIASAFLPEEVRRRRLPPIGRTGTARAGAPARWCYDPVTLMVACTDRWGTPEAVIRVRHGASLLGPIRSLVALEDDHRRRPWDPADYEAAARLLSLWGRG